MEFLKSITAKEAARAIASFPLQPLDVIEVELGEALEMVLARDVIADEDIPAFSRSLVDGYAVNVKDTYGARETNPAFIALRGHITVSQATDRKISEGESIYVATGAAIPEGADGVVMQEYARPAADAVEITRSVRKGENICFKGEDVKKGQIVLKKGDRLSPFDLGVLAALGVTRIPVYRRLRVGLISSGDEIVPPESVPPPGKIRDINSYTISALMRKKGALVTFAGIAPDTVEDITEKLSSVKECDVILLSGGSSKGQGDFMTAAIEVLGGRILFHGLNIRPGKPTIFGSLWQKPVFGLPGHPVSCSMVVIRFVSPLVSRLQGEEARSELIATGRLETNVPSSYGIEEYVRVTVRHGEDGLSVTPLFAKSSVISVLARADGYIVVPEGKEGLEQGEEVEVYPFG